MSGIPKRRQLAPRQSKKLPCSCDLRLASRIAWYSGVSGACWPLPHGLVGSKEGCPPNVPMRSTPLHCPFQSGYLISSPAATAPTVIASAAASGATLSAKAPIVLRQSIAVLPCAGAAYFAALRVPSCPSRRADGSTGRFVGHYSPEIISPTRAATDALSKSCIPDRMRPLSFV